jgi:hypothetical protein
MDERDEDKRFWKVADREAAQMAKANPRVELWREDAALLESMIAAFLNNKCLSREIVEPWLKQNHKLLVDDPNP